MTLDLLLLRPLLAAAVRGAESLAPAERADVYLGIAEVTAEGDPKMSTEARNFARAIQDAEALQLHFRHLFDAPAEG